MKQPLKVIRIADLDAAHLIGATVDADISPDLPRRQWLYAWLLDTKIAGNYHQSVDRWIGLLIVANLLALLFEHIPAVYLPYQSWFHLFDVASVAVFSAEYLLRLYLAPEDPDFKNRGSPRLRFMRSPFGLIDLLAIADIHPRHLITAARVIHLAVQVKVFQRQWIEYLHRFQLTECFCHANLLPHGHILWLGG